MAAPDALPPLRGRALAIMTLGLSFATFMEVLDITIANVSVPTIAGDLAVSATQGTWAITSYGVANAITVLLAGWLSRRFGEVRLFMFCSLGFTVASFFCGLASTLPFLVIMRVIQGGVAGPMVTMSQSLLLRNYAPEKRGMAMGIWGMTTVVAPMLGPILGGYITDHYSWPWIFFVNVPVGVIAAAMVWSTIGQRETPRTCDPVDMVGFALVVIGVGALQVCLDKGKELDWFESNFIIGLTIISGLALTALLIWELGEERPVVNLRLFQRRNFTVAVTVMSLGYAAMFSSIILMPLFLQTQIGYTATWAGMAIAPVGVFSIFMMPLIGRHVGRLNLRVVISMSMVIFAIAAFWRSTFTTGSDFGYFAMPQLVQGAALALFFPPLVALYTADLPMAQYASAASLMNFSRMTAGALATSAVTTVWDNREIVHQTYLASELQTGGPRFTELMATMARLGLDMPTAMAETARLLIQQSYMLAANDIFFASGCIFMLLVPVIWLARPAKAPAGAGAGAH